ncbi:site-specific integrase [Pseudozobellia sp. WGM2]|uniref:site-specific integrase n=1 Tax=Pseudozobellia sp. WGM2 TaxID=2787625 RepID=UPI001ADFB9C2|nr:site-specific integrase [Pseudozobellia sp. WGM2]
MASIKIVLRKKRRIDGSFPIYLRVTKDRKTKFFKTIFNAFPDEWDANAEIFTKKNSNYIQKNRLLSNIKDKAYRVYLNLKTEKERFTLSDFEHAFRVKSNPNGNNIFYFWDDLISEMLTAGRTGSARCHKDAFSTLQKFHGSTILNFENVNLAFLSKFEGFLRFRGGSDGGISVRMRCIRTVFNIAIERDITSADNYPFKKYKISKLKSKSAKRALEIGEVYKILNMDTSKHPELVDSRNYFLFSFYTRGMNFADIMKLKWSNIKDGFIQYTRSKTKGNFKIKILSPVEEILDYYRVQPTGTSYVFPLLKSDDLTPIEIERAKKQTLKIFNMNLKEIACHCQIEKTLTSYVARHSFANCLKQKGIATDIISESLGHQNLEVTQAYLKELDSSILDKASELLLPPQPTSHPHLRIC